MRGAPSRSRAWQGRRKHQHPQLLRRREQYQQSRRQPVQRQWRREAALRTARRSYADFRLQRLQVQVRATSKHQQSLAAYRRSVSEVSLLLRRRRHQRVLVHRTCHLRRRVNIRSNWIPPHTSTLITRPTNQRVQQTRSQTHVPRISNSDTTTAALSRQFIAHSVRTVKVLRQHDPCRKRENELQVCRFDTKSVRD